MIKRVCAALAAVLVISLSVAGWAPEAEPAVVKGVGFVKSEAALVVSVLIEGGYMHETHVLTGPDRLVVDISPAGRIEALPSYDVNAFGVKAIRTGQFKPRVSRVILDFSGPVPVYDIQKTASSLVIRIAGDPRAAETAAVPAAPAQPAAQDKPAGEAEPAPRAGVRAPVAPAAAEPQVASTEPAGEPVVYNTMVGVMGGSYKNNSARFGEVYGTGTSLQFGVSLSRTLVNVSGFCLDVSGEARLVSKTGKATLSGEEAKISIYPLSLAGRLLYQTRYIIPFVGYGGDWFNYREKSALANTSGWASGDHFQGGVYIVVPGMENLRVKVYYKYTRVKANENEIEVKLGGPEFGVGVSFGFNFLNRAVAVF